MDEPRVVSLREPVWVMPANALVSLGRQRVVEKQLVCGGGAFFAQFLADQVHHRRGASRHRRGELFRLRQAGHTPVS